MRHFSEWFRAQTAAQPWLILGKGPSFERRGDYELKRYRTLSLNHVVREHAVDVAHAIDLDVIDACADVLEQNAQVVVMPWFPHVRNAPGERTLEDWAKEKPVLARLAAAGRLVWYDLRTGPRRHGDHPVVQATYFSAEAALSLLALAGAKTVRSLGVDGGTAYGKSFDDLKDVTRLNNTHASFDKQFAGIARTILLTGVDYAPLTAEAPIRVFVGSEEPQMLAVKVLEYTIKRHASMTTEVVPLHRCGLTFPQPKDPRNYPRTPFSFQRFAIPDLAGRRGRAIYLDSDMQVFQDIRGLWDTPFGDADLLSAWEVDGSQRRPQFSVMLLDCERLPWSADEVVEALDSGRLTYEKLMYEMALARKVDAKIDPAWNSLERYEPGTTCLIHYTDMPRQPWVARNNPNGALWVRALREAIDDGYLSRREVVEHIERGWVRPSLLLQLDRREDGWNPVTRVRAGLMDRAFVPPYKSLKLAS